MLSILLETDVYRDCLYNIQEVCIDLECNSYFYMQAQIAMLFYIFQNTWLVISPTQNFHSFVW